MVKQSTFRSHGHVVYTEEMEKVGLGGTDTKVFILDDGVNCLSLGHYRIPEILAQHDNAMEVVLNSM